LKRLENALKPKANCKIEEDALQGETIREHGHLAFTLELASHLALQYVQGREKLAAEAA